MAFIFKLRVTSPWFCGESMSNFLNILFFLVVVLFAARVNATEAPGTLYSVADAAPLAVEMQPSSVAQ